jgi:hypothetical protein
MQITLCLDFGNTRKKAGLFHNDEIKEAVVLNDDSVIRFSRSLINSNHRNQFFHPSSIIMLK